MQKEKARRRDLEFLGSTTLARLRLLMAALAPTADVAVALDYFDCGQELDIGLYLQIAELHLRLSIPVALITCEVLRTLRLQIG